MLTPRRISTLIAVLTCLLAAAVATPAGAATHRHDPCIRKHTIQLAANAHVRVWMRDDSGLVYACSRTRGTVRFLYEDDYEYDGGSIVALKGRVVIYETYDLPACKADCPPGVTGSEGKFSLDVITGEKHTV
jgi:hypothetical protein